MTKKTIVFIPGLLGNETLWKNQIAFFQDKYECIVANITQQDNIDDMVLALLEQVPKEFHLIGFSLGGWVAFEFAQRYPEKTSTMSVICADACTLKPDTRTSMLQMIQHITDGHFEELINKLFPAFVALENQKNQKLKHNLLMMMHSEGPDVALRQLNALINFGETTIDFDTLQMPILIIHGQHDSQIDVSGLEQVANTLPQAQLECITNAGHFVPLENPSNLNRVIANWLNK